MIRSPEAYSLSVSLLSVCLFVDRFWISQSYFLKKMPIAFSVSFIRIMFLKLMFAIQIPTLVHGHYRHLFM